MREFLRYESLSTDDSLVPEEFGHESSFFNGQTEYSFRAEYTVTRGVRKGLGRAAEFGLIPEGYAPSGDAVLEVASNNLLPGLMDADGNVQYVKFRGGTSLARLDATPAVDILTAQCLFGEFGARVVLEDGQELALTSPVTSIGTKVAELKIDDRLSLYEHDAINRQAALVRNLLSGNGNYTSVTVCLPRVNYYLHAAEPYNNGLLSAEQMLVWMDAVDARYDRVFELVRGSIPDGVSVFAQTPLEEIREYVYSVVEDGGRLDFDDILLALKDTDALWARILERLPPRDLMNLRTDYVDALEERRIPNDINTRVIIKNPKEEAAFELGAKMSDTVGEAPRLIAMYALPQVVTSPRGPGLYRMLTAPSENDIWNIARQY